MILTPLIALDAKTYLAGQVEPSELEHLAKTTDIKHLISNRPDHEDIGQPTAETMAQAAEAAGLSFLSAPMQGMPSPDMVEAVADTLRQEGATLLFCRSGMRSAVIWALAAAANGGDPEVLRQTAFDAGFDLSGLPL